MSLVSSLLSLVILAACGTWALSLKVGGGTHRKVWRAATGGLRERTRLLPPIAAVVGWVVALAITTSVRADIGALLVLLVVPALIAVDMLAIGRPLMAEVAALVGLSIGATDDVETDENFHLPMDIYDSTAEDVNKWFSDGVAIPRRSLLTLGASGSGKSETLKHFVDQLRNDPTEPVVVFDMKTDYQDFLTERGVPMIRLSSGVRPTRTGLRFRGTSFRRWKPRETPTR